MTENKYDEVMGHIMKNNNFASIDIINSIDRKNNNNIKNKLNNMKNKQNTLKVYSNIFDDKQNSSREKNMDKINIFK